MRVLASILLLLFALPANPQILAVTAGGQNTITADGGMVTLHLPSSTSSLEGGVFNGHALFGFKEEMQLQNWLLQAGDQVQASDLPTDFYPNAGWVGRGLSTSRTRKGKDRLTVFLGATATQYSVGFFGGVKADTPIAALQYSRELSEHWEFGSLDTVSTGKQTSIQSLAWRPRNGVLFSGSAGASSNQGYAAGLFSLDQKNITVKLGYTFGTGDFQRIILTQQLIPQNKGLNASLVYRLRNVSFVGIHQDMLAVYRQSVASAIVSSAGVYAQAGIIDLNASAFESRSRGLNSQGQSVGVGARLWDGVITEHSTYFRSSNNTFWLHSVNEQIGFHWRLSQFVNQDMGKISFSAGGGYISNRLSVSLQEQVFFMPFYTGRSAFQKSTVLTLSVHLPHSSAINANTFLDPTGKVRYSVAGGSYFYPNLPGAGSQQRGVGKFVTRVQIVNEKGEPVEGGAVLIGKEEVFSNSQGEILIRTNKIRGLPLKVLPGDFSLGEWAVISAPASVRSGDEHSEPVKVVVRKVE